MSNTILIQALAGSTLILNADEFTDLSDHTAEVPAPAAAPRSWSNPMTQDQRRALFAGFSDAFGRDHTRDERHLFTLAVLGEDIDPSWSSAGTLTYEQGAKLLTVLSAVNAIL